MTVSPHPEWHPVFETLAYAAGFAWYRHMRQAAGDVIEEGQRWRVIAASIVGALVGSRVLGLLESSGGGPISLQQWFVPSGGKTIVGGLLGGWLGVELVKYASRVRTRTGDLFALPLCLGIAIGRVGCFLAGLADGTYGTATSLPWGVDFGDGVRRHPTQVYEIVFLAGLMLALVLITKRRSLPNGAAFRIFLAAYLAWRLLIDFLKPQPQVFGMNLIQWACVAGLVGLAITSRDLFVSGRRANS